MLSGEKGIGKFTFINHFLHYYFDKENYDENKYEIIQEKNIMVNSIHHQGIDKLGEDLKITAKSNDGVIEGLSLIHISEPTRR